MSAGLLALPNCRITGSWLDDDDGPEACVCVCAGGVAACGGAEEAWRLVAQNQRHLLLLVVVASLQSPSTKLGEPAAAQVHGAVHDRVLGERSCCAAEGLVEQPWEELL